MEKSIEILNFGALLAFMAVNLAALRHFGFSSAGAEERRPLLDVLVPGMGFVFCLVIFLGLQESTLIAGTIWVIAGGVYAVWKTKIFGQPIAIDFNESGP